MYSPNGIICPICGQTVNCFRECTSEAMELIYKNENPAIKQGSDIYFECICDSCFEQLSEDTKSDLFICENCDKVITYGDDFDRDNNLDIICRNCLEDSYFF